MFVTAEKVGLNFKPILRFYTRKLKEEKQESRRNLLQCKEKIYSAPLQCH